MGRFATRSWAVVDRSTRVWWRAVGRRVDHVPWLDAPVGVRGGGGEAWLGELRRAGMVVDGSDTAGILPDLSALDGPGFTAEQLHPDVRDFYQHTAAWGMDVWIGWSAAFAPFGGLLARWFGERVHQLAIPVDPLESAYGLDSEVLSILDRDGRHTAAAWLRTLRSSGHYLYSGHYTTARIPGEARPVVHVSFPLESGNIQVFLRPVVDPDGALRLLSPHGAFGAAGAYAVIDEPAGRFAARLPLREEFRIYPDDRGHLRTDHRLQWWNAQVLRLHYRMQRAGA